ncbi:ABC transporter ATP-binding protein [Nocardioides sp. L-11A]|uniref:ABC transporter ATP-binding protein n=1 Tax=Nocardioides sp. L-11A TaxID=3043848 RepID=UPI00249CE29F|nr:ATP-binding cassette domain-containing protein [Nocardioides sp. L-11A]
MSSGLSCTALDAGYGRMVVCRDIELTVEPGGLLAILGPNGAGKSTLLQALAGITQKAGTVRLGEVDVSRRRATARARAGIAFVPETRGNIFATMTVRENLAIAGRSTPTERRRLRHAMAQEVFPALETYADRASGLLSGGEQQMLAIAMALLADPKVILLDEPSQGLAPSVLRDIEQALRALRPSGITVVLAEQNQRFATSLADRVLHISAGRLVAPAAAYQEETAGGAIGVLP